MWIRPRRTMRRILDDNPEYGVIPLAMAGGVNLLLNGMLGQGNRALFTPPFTFAAAFLLGPMVGVLLLYLIALLLQWTGRWIEGKASGREIRAAIAWPHVLTVWGMILWVPRLLLFPEETLSGSPADPPILLGVMEFLDAVVVCWFLVVFWKCLAEVQCFTLWRTLGSLFLANTVLSIAVGILFPGVMVVAA